MKEAVKVLSIISIVFEVIIGIIVIASKGLLEDLFKWSYENGHMYVNGEHATQAEYEFFVALIPWFIIFAVIIIVISIAISVANIYISKNDNKTAILVIAIIDFVCGHTILAILNILDYADIDKKKPVETQTVELE